MAANPRQPHKILVVDGSPAYRSLTRRLLPPERFQVIEAGSGREAHEILRRQSVDIVLLDYALGSGDADGKLLSRLRADPATRVLPVVAVSESGERRFLLEMIAAGATEGLSKLETEELLPAVQRALAKAARGELDAPRADVLHVEDDDDWASLVRIWLESRGMIVHRLRSRAEASEYLARGGDLPRCLLLDLELQDGNGLGLCDWVKSTPRTQALPIVVLSGSPGDALACLEHRALYRVDKSRSPEQELVAILRSVFEQFDRAREMLDIGDLTLDPSRGVVLHRGRPVAELKRGPFAALALLARTSPDPVSDHALYEAFLSRRPYKKSEPELARTRLVRNYISGLRSQLGPRLAERIVRRKDYGYAYAPSAADRAGTGRYSPSS